jgi:hypothetical protein
MYVVSSDKKSYVLWAQLENASDSEIFNEQTAKCKDTPPLGSEYNYCLKQDF